VAAGRSYRADDFAGASADGYASMAAAFRRGLKETAMLKVTTLRLNIAGRKIGTIACQPLQRLGKPSA